MRYKIMYVDDDFEKGKELILCIAEDEVYAKMILRALRETHGHYGYSYKYYIKEEEDVKEELEICEKDIFCRNSYL